MKKTLHILFVSVLAFVLLTSMALLSLAEGAEVAEAPATTYLLRETYNTDTLWATTEAGVVQDPAYSNFYKHQSEGLPGTIAPPSDNSVFGADLTLTVTSVRNGGNYIYRYFWQPSGTVEDFDGIVMTADVWYEAGNFDGMLIRGWYQSSQPFARIEVDGAFHTWEDSTRQVSVPIGQLSEGWNTVITVITPIYVNGALTGYNTYWMLNQDLSGGQLTRAYVEAQPNYVWARTKAISADAQEWIAYAPLDGDATADSPATLKTKSFKTYVLTEKELVTASFDGYSDLSVTVPQGTTITLPSSNDILVWMTADSEAYEVGAAYTVEANITFTAHTLSSVTAEIDAELAAFESADTLEEQYDALMAAIRLYQTVQDRLSGETVTALDNAIAAYNAVVASVNGNALEATTVAVAVSLEPLSNSQIAAMLSDIKSKVLN